MNTRLFLDLTELETAEARELFRSLREQAGVVEVEPLITGVPMYRAGPGIGKELKQMLVHFEPELRRAGYAAALGSIALIRKWWKKRYGAELTDEECTPIYHPDGTVALRVPKPKPPTAKR